VKLAISLPEDGTTSRHTEFSFPNHSPGGRTHLYVPGCH